MHDLWVTKDETFLDEIKNVNPIKSLYDGYDLFEIPSYCYKTKFPNHNKNKQLILDELSKMRPGEGCFHKLTKEDFTIKAGQDPIIEALKVLNLPLTRQNYLELSYPDGIPESSAELEESLPEEFRSR